MTSLWVVSGEPTCFFVDYFVGPKACHEDLEIDEKEWLIAHGKSTFMKADRAAKLIRENTAGGQLTCLCFDSDPSLIASVVGSTVAQSLLVTTCGCLSNLVCYQI